MVKTDAERRDATNAGMTDWTWSARPLGLRAETQHQRGPEYERSAAAWQRRAQLAEASPPMAAHRRNSKFATGSDIAARRRQARDEPPPNGIGDSHEDLIGVSRANGRKAASAGSPERRRYVGALRASSMRGPPHQLGTAGWPKRTSIRTLRLLVQSVRPSRPQESIIGGWGLLVGAMIVDKYGQIGAIASASAARGP